MRIAILSRYRRLYSTQKLRDAARARGHTVTVLDPLRCYMNIAASNASMHYNGKALPRFDAVLPRIGASITFYGSAVVRQFETMGTYCLNSSAAIVRARDKLHCMQILAQRGIALPVTGFASSPGDTEDLLELVGGAPVVLKLLEGTQGKGVVLAETRKAAESVIDAFRGAAANFLVQQFVEEAGGRDLRCLVIGGRVVAAMERQAAPGDFRSNLHRGGTGRSARPTAQERRIAIDAAAAIGLSMAGIDILRSQHGPVVIDVNASPGLEGIEQATKKDIAALIVRCLERTSREGE
jgi:ribosomal protein S6--L-glutamate ligase